MHSAACITNTLRLGGGGEMGEGMRDILLLHLKGVICLGFYSGYNVWDRGILSSHLLAENAIYSK